MSDTVESSKVNNSLHFFFGQECSFTKKVEPAVNCLEKMLGQKVNRHEVWHNSTNQRLYREAGGAVRCGGVPYFYNADTKQTICGYTSCEMLRQWAESRERERAAKNESEKHSG